jgi:hypothetical protein
MDDERITLRMGTEEVSAMDAFLEKNPALGTRSLFIRTAIREYINRDAGVSAQPVQSSDLGKTGVFVEMPEEMCAYVKEAAKEIMALNGGDYIRHLVRREAMTKEEEQQIARDVFVGSKRL